MEDWPQAITTAEALATGMTPWRLRTEEFRRTSHGLYVPTLVPDDLRSRCRALLRLLPEGAAFSGPTAALLWGWRQPHWPDTMPICVDVPEPIGNPKREGLRVNHGDLKAVEIVELAGLPLTTPARTIADLAALVGLPDLVVMVDDALRRGAGLMAALQAYADRRGHRGVRLLRQAVRLSDPRSQSAGESILRLVHQLSGIPVDCQHAVYDEFGGWLARGDLLVVGTRRLHEYDGGPHRSAEQHAKDLSRENVLKRAGYERYGYTGRDVFVGSHQIVADAEAALGWPHDPNRVDPWIAAYQRSLFNPPVRRFFARRGRLPALRPARSRRRRRDRHAA